jgi:hypothetical protein
VQHRLWVFFFFFPQFFGFESLEFFPNLHFKKFKKSWICLLSRCKILPKKKLVQKCLSVTWFFFSILWYWNIGEHFQIFLENIVKFILEKWNFPKTSTFVFRWKKKGILCWKKHCKPIQSGRTIDPGILN